MSTEESPNESENNQKKISRRDFLKYSVGVAAVAAGAAAMIDRIPLPSGQTKSASTIPSRPDNSEPIVAAVDGDQLTVMNGQVSVKVRDAGLAALIASKLEGRN